MLTDLDSTQVQHDGTTYYVTVVFYAYENGCVPLVVDDMDVETAETFRIEWGTETTDVYGSPRALMAGTDTIEIRDNDSRKGTHTCTHAHAYINIHMYIM